jgi:hypothetical protein
MMALLFYADVKGTTMENQGATPQPPRPFDGTEGPRQPEQAIEPSYRASAAPAPSRDSRMSEPAVATDGQIVEAGYGHGV